MKKILLPFLVGVIGLVGCTNSDDPSNDANSSRNIAFDAYAGKTTKVALTTNANFAQFNVYGYKGAGTNPVDWANPLILMDNIIVSKTAGIWSTNTSIKWPAAGTITQFYAFAPSNLNYTRTTNNPPSINFTANTVVANQVDMLTAHSHAITAPADGVQLKVPLNFSHALSKIKVRINAAQGLRVYLQSFEICNINSIATYNYNLSQDPSWTDHATPTNFPVTINSIAYNGIDHNSTVFTNATETDGEALVIPQTTTAWNPSDQIASTTGSYIKMQYRLQNIADGSFIVGDTDFVTAYFPAAFNYEINKAYSYNVTFGASGGASGGGGYDANGAPIITPDRVISFDVTFTDWDSSSIDNPVDL